LSLTHSLTLTLTHTHTHTHVKGSFEIYDKFAEIQPENFKRSNNLGRADAAERILFKQIIRKIGREGIICTELDAGRSYVFRTFIL
jgi:hypothetical protein